MLFLLVILGFVGLYIGAQLARRKRMLRYANTELLESVAPQRPKRWPHRIRQVPAIDSGDCVGEGFGGRVPSGGSWRWP